MRKLKLNRSKTCNNETKITKLWRNMDTNIFKNVKNCGYQTCVKMCSKHLRNIISKIDLSLLKVACLIEVSPKIIQ